MCAMPGEPRVPASRPESLVALPAAGQERGFLLARFGELYRELAAWKRRIERREERSNGEVAALAPVQPREVWQSLRGLLERQGLAAAEHGGDLAVELYRRAQYVMAALADETFLNREWSGRGPWRERLLEAELFGTHRAGEEVFERLDALLHGGDRAHTELAQVYLLVLGLGFEGKLRGLPEGPAVLAAYRRTLYRFIYRGAPRIVRGQERLVPQAYEATASGGEPRRLPHLRRWLWAAAAVLALWLLVGHLLWRDAVRPLVPPVDEILTEVSPLLRPGPAGEDR